MSSAAQREDPSEGYLPSGSESRSALKQLAAERLAAHRNRRSAVESRQTPAETTPLAGRSTAHVELHPDVARVREAVAARYRKSESYREFLAREAERAVEQAQAQVEVAARSAKAVAEAQRQLLNEIGQWDRPAAQAGPAELFAQTQPGENLLQPQEPLTRPAEVPQRECAEAPGERELPSAGDRIQSSPLPEAQVDFDFAPAAGPLARFTAAHLQVRLHDEVELALPAQTRCQPSPQWPVAADELAELDEEIEFRRAPEFNDILLEPQPIPTNIIEFPRELVASRKARPRLAEGPLRADSVPHQDLLPSEDEAPRAEGMPTSQLRIFEVEPEQISTEPEPAGPERPLVDAPVWQGMVLGAGPAAETRVVISAAMEEQLHPDQPMYAAPVRRRFLSAAVDLACVAAGLAASSTLAVRLAGSRLQHAPGALLGGSAAAAFVVFALLYQMLFFTLNEATPGMRVARVAFCTFQERNPSRRAIRRRLISTALAACPLGLGLVWMLLDHDSLGWHDRMSRMYPRAY